MKTKTAAPVGWFEIGAEDPAAAEAFYASVFGWEFADGPTGPEYRVTDAGDGPGGGITSIADAMPGRYAMFSMAVPDVAASCAAVAEHGGSVLVGPVTMADTGLEYAVLTDPEGNQLGVFCPPA